MLALIITLLLGPVLTGLYGYLLGYSGKWLSFIIISIGCLLTFYSFYNVFNGNNLSINLGSWISTINLDWSITFDKLSCTILIPVLCISTLVQLYACSYISSDPTTPRFFAYLSLFTLLIVLLLGGDNYGILFIGWEGVGVISYLLIGYWTSRVQAIKSALSALLLNRVGDSFFVLGLCLIYNTYGTLDYTIINSTCNYTSATSNYWICILLLIASAAKSAQFGLHGWLLNAIEGPTPVSALLHAATIVTAGCYVLIRSSALLEYSPSALLIVLFLGSFTTIAAGLIAVVSSDIKRVIALSTISQLGLIIIAIGGSGYNIALFHLFCHSFFKALLFMSAGAIIHSVISESQDIRTYGGFNNYLPFTYTCLLIASLSLIAIPGLTGFYSKDTIIESILGIYTISGYCIYWIALLSATLTSLYSIRLLYLTFFNRPIASKYVYQSIIETDYIMIIPITILAICSIFVGYLFRDIIIGFGTNVVFQLPHTFSLVETEFTLSPIFKLLPLTLGITVSILTIYSFEFITNNFKSKNYRSTFSLFNQRLIYDQLLNHLVIRSGLNLGGSLNKYVDQGILQWLGPNGWHSLSEVASTYLRNSLKYRFFSIFIGLIILGLVVYFIPNLSLLFVLIVLVAMV